MINKKFVLIVCVSFIMASVLTFGVTQNPSNAENVSKIANKDLINKTGKVAKENLKEITKLNAALLKKATDLTVAATINDTVDLNVEEFMYLKKMYSAYGMDKSDDYIFNVLVEEKVKFAEAEKRGLLPTEKELTDYLKMEQQMAKENPEVFQELIDASGLTEDEYWNTYERFYATKIVAFGKLSKAIFEEAGLANSEKVNNDLLEAQKVHYKQYIQELKNKAKVTINKEFKDFSYDKTVLTVK
ncbi:MAG: hypothetical protein ACOYVD_04275 [Bacillota bacterium]